MIVVAALAWAHDVDVVKPGASPGLIGVTVITSITADNMLRVLTRGAAVVMAQYALKRRALEHSANVTAGAV